MMGEMGEEMGVVQEMEGEEALGCGLLAGTAGQEAAWRGHDCVCGHKHNHAHTVALAEGGVLWVWGNGAWGQLGLGDRDNRLVPTRLGAGDVFAV